MTHDVAGRRVDRGVPSAPHRSYHARTAWTYSGAGRGRNAQDPPERVQRSALGQGAARPDPSRNPEPARNARQPGPAGEIARPAGRRPTAARAGARGPPGPPPTGPIAAASFLGCRHKARRAGSVLGTELGENASIRRLAGARRHRHEAPSSAAAARSSCSRICSVFTGVSRIAGAAQGISEATRRKE